MRVYVESNFVLELTRRQEQAQACQALLDAARNKLIDLRVPSHALAEPLQTIHRNAVRAGGLARRLQRVCAQMARTELFRTKVATLHDTEALLAEAINTEEEALKTTLIRIVHSATLLNTSRESVELGLNLPLKLDDAMIAGSILVDLKSLSEEPACFVTRDKDFGNPDVLGYFAANNCKVLFSFEDTRAFLKLS